MPLLLLRLRFCFFFLLFLFFRKNLTRGEVSPDFCLKKIVPRLESGLTQRTSTLMCLADQLHCESVGFFFCMKRHVCLIRFFIQKWGIWCNHILQLPEPVAQITISWYTIILIGLGHLQCGLKSNRSRWKSNTTHCGSRLIVVRGKNRPPNTVRRERIKKGIHALRSPLSCGSTHNPKPLRLDE